MKPIQRILEDASCCCAARSADFCHHIQSLMLSSLRYLFYKQCLNLCSCRVSTKFYGIGDYCRSLAVLMCRILLSNLVINVPFTFA